MRVLVVEDEKGVASFVKKGLESEHYAVDVAAEGEEGRFMAEEFDYDLLILDLNLPGVDGLEVLKQIRLKKPAVPVLVLTARNRVEDRVKGLVWNFSVDTMTNVVDGYINYLRKKVDEAFPRKLIHTVRGVGYQMGDSDN